MTAITDGADVHRSESLACRIADLRPHNALSNAKPLSRHGPEKAVWRVGRAAFNLSSIFILAHFIAYYASSRSTANSTQCAAVG